MRKVTVTKCAAVGCIGMFNLAANAQSSVEIYGLIDTGIAYVNNIGGKSKLLEQGGGTAANRLGFRGYEDLGGGQRAFFTLEGGFNGDDGSMAQGSPNVSRIFGRQAFIGLSSRDLGTVSVGRMYDFMFDMNRYGSNSFVGAYYLRPLVAGNYIGSNGSSTDIDLLGGMRVDNSIKYVTPAWGGFSAGALYGMGEQSGSISRGRSASLTAQYDFKPFSVKGVYTMHQDAVTGGKYAVTGAGFAWNINDNLAFNALYTSSKWDLTGDKVDVYDVGLRYWITSPLSVGIAYARYQPNHDSTNTILVGKRNQIGASVQYALSKRTTLYSLFTYQHADKGNAQMYFLSATDAAEKVQTVLHLGIRHTF